MNLASNHICDEGGQYLIAGCFHNTTLQELNLSHNNIADKTCFVVAQMMTVNSVLSKVDLGTNPLGEAGSRAIFRSILQGKKTFVSMKGSSYEEDISIFQSSFPSIHNPYTFDLSVPYDNAVYSELRHRVETRPSKCSIVNVTYKATSTSTTVEINCSGGDITTLPDTGIVQLSYLQTTVIPTSDEKLSLASLSVMEYIVHHGNTVEDQKQWLRLLCQDVFMTTTQAQSMINYFESTYTISPGAMSRSDVIMCLWDHVVDNENLFDFVVRNTANENARRDLAIQLSLKRYQFNWLNPTGHWSLSLADHKQRKIMQQLVAINTKEIDLNQKTAGRGDTSQLGNWSNFRNLRYAATQGNEIMGGNLPLDFFQHIPNVGHIEVDYVSTIRPNFGNPLYKDADGPFSQQNPSFAAASPPSSALGKSRESNNSRPGSDSKPQSQMLDALNAAANVPNALAQEILGLTLGTGVSEEVETIYTAPLINDDEFYALKELLQLSSRRKLSRAHSTFVLLDLRHASSKWYFTIENVHALLDCFTDEWEVQAQVIISIFSRIFDLHHLDILLRYLKMEAQQKVISTLGYLNIINPLKVGFDYVIDLRYWDNRILLVMLIELASSEAADNILEEPTTELPINTLYGSYSRALDQPRPEVMRFTYADFGVRTKSVNWNMRREMTKSFLLGTQPINESMFEVISIYKELETANALSIGPIDLQYGSYVKSVLKKAGNLRMRKQTDVSTGSMVASSAAAFKKLRKKPSQSANITNDM